LLLPGFPNNLDVYLVTGLGEAMAKQGISMLCFTYSGTYESEGTFSRKNTQEDIDAAFAWLHQENIVRQFQLNINNFVLGGISYGGGMGLSYTAKHPEVRRVFSVAGTNHSEFARDYLRDPEFAQYVDKWLTDLTFPAGPVNFEDGETFAELAQNSVYDLNFIAPSLADRDILLIAGWDDSAVTLESHILPFYRTLVASNAQKVQITAFQDNHIFENSVEQLTQTVVNWILSM